ncbi:MAG: type II secretion system F family protein, partial [Methanobacteriota archaeon]
LPAPPEDESLQAHFRRTLVAGVLSSGLSILVLVLVILEVIALFAAIGFFFLVGGFVEAFVRGYVTFLAFCGAFVAAVLIFAADLPRDDPPPRRLGVSIAFAVAGVLFAVLGSIVALGRASAVGLPPIIPERAPFILTLTCLFVVSVVKNEARLPGIARVTEWLQTEEYVVQSNLHRIWTRTLSYAALAVLVVAAVPGSGLVGSRGIALFLVALAIVLTLAATYGCTVLRERTRFGDVLDMDARVRRKIRLLGAAWTLIAYAAVVLVLGANAFLAAAFGSEFLPGVTALLVLAHPLLLAVLAAIPIGIVLFRFTVPGGIEDSDARKAAGYVALLATTVLLFIGVLMGSGIVRGAAASPEMALALTSMSLAAEAAFVYARGLIPYPGQEIGVPSRKAEKAVREETRPEDLAEAMRRRMTAVYLVGISLSLVLTALVIALQLGVLPIPRGSAEARTVYIVSFAGMLAIVGVVVYFYFRTQKTQEVLGEQKKEIGKRKLAPEEVQRLAILGVSGTFAFVFVVLGILIFLEQVASLGPITVGKQHGTDFFVYAVLVGLGPYGYFWNLERKRIGAIDGRFPEFLRDLAESKRAGMTLTQAVVTASKGTYGALTPEIRKMAAMIEWGISFEDALTRFAKRVRTPLIERSVSLINQASSAGGNVEDVLTAAASDAREIQQIIKERTQSMSIYVMIIYIAFLVFLGVIGILDAQFIPEVSKAVKGAAGVSVGTITFQEFDEAAFKMVFFHAAVIQAVGGGLVAGVMEAGKPQAGLKHVFAMTIMAYVMFRIVIG